MASRARARAALAMALLLLPASSLPTGMPDCDGVPGHGDPVAPPSGAALVLRDLTTGAVVTAYSPAVAAYKLTLVMPPGTVRVLGGGGMGSSWRQRQRDVGAANRTHDSLS